MGESFRQSETFQYSEMERLWIDLRCTEHVPSLRDSVDFQPTPGLTSWVNYVPPLKGLSFGSFCPYEEGQSFAGLLILPQSDVSK